jgi:TRAP-type mannitol/chloroaromatic compound transport system permease small subunit
VFLLCAAYTLLKGEHVKIDILYGRLSRRTQVLIDIFGTLFFLMPLCILTIWLVSPVVDDKILSGEMSSNSGGLILWPVWILIPIGFGLLALQGVSEIIKRVAFLAGAGPDPAAEQAQASH